MKPATRFFKIHGTWAARDRTSQAAMVDVTSNTGPSATDHSRFISRALAIGRHLADHLEDGAVVLFGWLLRVWSDQGEVLARSR
jgi:hypothetical protein